jgi:hypothetical protein
MKTKNEDREEYVPTALRQVWEWKDAIYQETKHLSTHDALRYIHEQAAEVDASTVFFREPGGGKAVVKPLALSSRAHAEIIFKLAQLGLHGKVHLPDKESAAQALKLKLDDRKISDVSGLLQYWMIHGKPRKERKKEEE